MSEEKNSNSKLLKLIALILAVGIGYYIYDSVSSKKQEECLREAKAEKQRCQRLLGINSCQIHDYTIEKCYE